VGIDEYSSIHIVSVYSLHAGRGPNYRLCVVAFVSSWVLEMDSFAIRSSRTFWDSLFSFDMLAVGAVALSKAGMVER